MSRPLDSTIGRLLDLESSLGLPGRYVVAFSGGLDSTVLLHTLVRDDRLSAPVMAVHVDHRLQANSKQFSDHCVRAAQKLGIECLSLAVDVAAAKSGQGVEAAAREARYEAIVSIMQPGDWVLSAHHANDQAETLLLNLLRGSGPDGLAAMPVARRLGPGWLVRPLLETDRAILESAARNLELDWIEDPSNAATEFDRNFLRLEVLPVLARRWPNAVARLTRSVARAQDARVLLTSLGAEDVRKLGEPARLSVSGLLEMDAARCRNAIRFAARQLGLPTPPGATLESILSDVLPAREDANPLASWAGAEARRYRDALYLLPTLESVPQGSVEVELPVTELPSGLGRLCFEDAPTGLSPAVMARELSVRWREGGETIRIEAGGPTRKLKTLLQDAAVVPWLRQRLPLLYANEELVAVADLFVAADATGSPGTRVSWLDHPPLG